MVTIEDVESFPESREIVLDKIRELRSELDRLIAEAPAQPMKREIFFISQGYEEKEKELYKFMSLHKRFFSKKKSDIDIEVIKAIPLYDIIKDYVELKRVPSGWRGLSPFKKEKTPSFFINESKNLYYCFSTNQGGDGIKFIMSIHNLDFKEAVKFLSKYT